MLSQQAVPPFKRFTATSITELASSLTENQKRLFDEVWNHYVAFGNSFPRRSLPSIFGKQPIQEAFKGLNGSLIYETMEQANCHFKLTVYGAFLTGHGHVLYSLLVRLLDLVKELYEKDSFIKELNKDQIKDRLGLSDVETQILFRLLNLDLPAGMPIYLSNRAPDGSQWSIAITDEVIGLFQADETVAYLNDHLSAGYQPDKPYSYEEKMGYEMRGGALQNPPLTEAFASPHQKWEHSPVPYVNTSRLEELRRINNTNYDCTRLICMCEELNECASSENAHAVIMLTRAILDHVPPVFGCKNFAEVASNYVGGGKSFKESIERLDKHSRKVADRLLHMQIRNKEVVPNMTEVSFASEIDTLLAEFCRILK